MFSLVQLVTWAIAFGSMTRFSNVFAQSTCASEFTVQQGDSCAIIAAATGVTITALEAANPQINSGCTNLSIGEVLCIPGAAACSSGVTYAVQNGNSCAQIASMFNITIAALDASNPEIDANCDNLFVGEVLCIPAATTGSSCGATYQVQSGDSCTEIADTFGVTLAALFASNPQINDPACNNLFIGETLCIP